MRLATTALCLGAALWLGAAAPPTAAPADSPAPGPEQWGIITNLPDGSCGARAPAGAGVDFDLALAPGHALSMLIGNSSWRIQPRTYDVVIRLDDLPPFGLSMIGQGPALVGNIPPDFRPELLTAGKIGFHVLEHDYTVRVRDIAGVVARLETCVAARRAAAHPAK